MKTNRFYYLIITAICLTACSPRYYDVQTKINKDGTINREIYTLADSAFMAGDDLHNPFLYTTATGWEVRRFSTTQTLDLFGESRKINSSMTRTASSFDEFAALTLTREQMRPLALPVESLEKKFRWFYTFYEYEAIYGSVKEMLPVLLDEYLTKEEQELWLKGDINGYPGINGIELNGLLDDIEKKFWKWFSRIQYELSFEVVEHFNNRVKENQTLAASMKELKEKAYQVSLSPQEEPDCTPEDVCRILDNYLNVDHFASLYNEYGKEMDQMMEEKSKPIELFEIVLHYQLHMPGDLLSTNSTISQNDAVVWRVDAYKLLNGDYTLSATSRVANTWAFVVTALLIVLAAYCLVRLYILKRK